MVNWLVGIVIVVFIFFVFGVVYGTSGARSGYAKGIINGVKMEITDMVVCPCDSCDAEYKLIDEYGYFCDLVCQQRTYWVLRKQGAEAMARLLGECNIKEV